LESVTDGGTNAVTTTVTLSGTTAWASAITAAVTFLGTAYSGAAIVGNVLWASAATAGGPGTAITGGLTVMSGCNIASGKVPTVSTTLVSQQWENQ
jgi:hypothetical protein